MTQHNNNNLHTFLYYYLINMVLRFKKKKKKMKSQNFSSKQLKSELKMYLYYKGRSHATHIWLIKFI